MKMLFATNNQGKLKEFSRLVQHLDIQVLSQQDLNLSLQVEESGESFLENARLKAWAFFEETGIATLADDSGLCVDALNGRPGVATARYGGEVDYPEKFSLLLKELEDVPKLERTAYFQCNLCCVLTRELVLETQGKVAGWIGFEPSGHEGFGYDPIFYIGNKSFAEYSKEDKDSLSHRGRAISALSPLLKQHIKSEE